MGHVVWVFGLQILTQSRLFVLLICAALHVRPAWPGVWQLHCCCLLAPSNHQLLAPTLFIRPLPATLWSFIELSLDICLQPLPNLVLKFFELLEMLIWEQNTITIYTNIMEVDHNTLSELCPLTWVILVEYLSKNWIWSWEELNNRWILWDKGGKTKNIAEQLFLHQSLLK